MVGATAQFCADLFWFRPGGWGGGLGGGKGDSDCGKIILIILVVIGLLIALKWIYTKVICAANVNLNACGAQVSEYAALAARHTQTIVLDAHHLHHRNS